MLELVKVIISPLFSLAEKLAPGIHEKMVGQPVKYGDVIRLKHVATSHALHSHRINYSHPRSSQQQQVTAYSDQDSNDYWLVKVQHGLPSDRKSGQSLRHNDILRLEHVPTKTNLHSHIAPSPLTGQQEVTAFGVDGEGDANDNWRVEVDGKGIWFEKKKVRLIHLDTKSALHSHAGHSHPVFTAGQQEVTCYTGRDDNDYWIVDR